MELLKKNIHSPETSSCGRLFDAASALLGVCEVSDYEGQAAMMLESLVTDMNVLKNGWAIESNQLSLLPLFEQLISYDAIEGANLFHGTVSAALIDWLIQYAAQYDIKTILFSGGCFLNKILTEHIINELNRMKMTPIFSTQCPPNDGGVSLGQAWIAGNKMMELTTCV